MGSILSYFIKSSQLDDTIDFMPTTSNDAIISLETPTLPTTIECKTRSDIIDLYGNPISETPSTGGFFAKSYEEDCFLMGGGRQQFLQRLEFKIDNSRTIVYVDSNDAVVRIF